VTKYGRASCPGGEKRHKMLGKKWLRRGALFSHDSKFCTDGLMLAPVEARGSLGRGGGFDCSRLKGLPSWGFEY